MFRATLRITAAASVFLIAGFVSGVEFVHADGGAQHRVSLSRPIALGVSGGSADDLDGGFCCGGTLGGVVEDCDGNLYVLSNNHVLGRTNRAVAGEDIVQPALIDSRCRSSASDVVADFTEYIEISFDQDNFVDAAIAAVRNGRVDADGDQLDVGTVSPAVLEPYDGLAVQKDGRTTGHTTGAVSAIGVSVIVSYGKKCGAGGGPGALMREQFRVTDGSFSDSGDSGSVIYSAGSNPQPVGLLFAGSSNSTIANTMSNVLNANWGVGPLAMAGGTPSGCSGGCTVDSDCIDGDSCTVDTCNGGACSNTPMNCDDGDSCTTDTCSGGTCSHAPVNCDDGNVCTIDGCDAVAGCINTVDSTCVDPCGDGVCDVSAEDCRNCPADCNGTTHGRKSLRFCCGDDVGCSDSRCNDAAQCTGTLGTETSKSRGLGLAAAKTIKDRHSASLFAIEDVVGHGVGINAIGEPVIEVYLARGNAAARRRIPRSLEGVAVRVEVTGPFYAY